MYGRQRKLNIKYNLIPEAEKPPDGKEDLFNNILQRNFYYIEEIFKWSFDNMKHSAPGTFDTECSVHDILYISHCFLTVKKSVSKTGKKKPTYFTELLFFWKYGTKLSTSMTINSR